ncbi:hypothetical protein TgHK011_006218 [Trichoderma gracile]|nr:hypothetical protein TgHK011_006218 [Trichoderma gracile]
MPADWGGSQVMARAGGWAAAARKVPGTSAVGGQPSAGAESPVAALSAAEEPISGGASGTCSQAGRVQWFAASTGWSGGPRYRYMCGADTASSNGARVRLSLRPVPALWSGWSFDASHQLAGNVQLGPYGERERHTTDSPFLRLTTTATTITTCQQQRPPSKQPSQLPPPRAEVSERVHVFTISTCIAAGQPVVGSVSCPAQSQPNIRLLCSDSLLLASLLTLAHAQQSQIQAAGAADWAKRPFHGHLRLEIAEGHSPALERSQPPMRKSLVLDQVPDTCAAPCHGTGPARWLRDIAQLASSQQPSACPPLTGRLVDRRMYGVCVLRIFVRMWFTYSGRTSPQLRREEGQAERRVHEPIHAATYLLYEYR